MNDSTFINPISIYALPVQDQDLIYFESANDLPLVQALVAFDQKRIDAGIDQHARQAQLQGDAESALMLAELFQEDAHRRLEYLELAEVAAYALGQHSYQRGRAPQNPFQNLALATAWNNGYAETARHDLAAPPANELEAKLWNEGVETDHADSQFVLAALALLRLADLTRETRVKVRAQRLAQEMICYHQATHVPSHRRQLEIDRFLHVQTRRLAAAIDFSGF